MSTPSVNQSMARRLLLFSLAAVIPALHGQTLDHAARTFQDSDLVSSKPLADAAEMLQVRYGKPVTYEDPVWQWRGDFQDAAGDPHRPYGHFAVQRTIHLPPGLMPAQNPALDAALLGKVLDEYHKQNDAPRFRVLESKFGLHIIPETVRDANGVAIVSKNPLDSFVTIPRATRSLFDQLESICAAASQSAGMRIECTAFSWGRDDWYRRLFAAPGDAIEWGADGVTARDALIDFLSKSATTFSWRLYCGNPGFPSPTPGCALNLETVQVVQGGDQGNLRRGRLEFDRRSH